ncbi:hypothetical protein [cyanobacterium endosymbiont of Rhopalodia gibberula]|nr:hypothetical protein [cyanobacterium endosymbiont of Rhopalodia gibberula]
MISFYRYVEHTHADLVPLLTNTSTGWGQMSEIYGDCVVFISYMMYLV